jgi:FKBP-type peptidyl-prolyl cis-trans isomerase
MSPILRIVLVVTLLALAFSLSSCGSKQEQASPPPGRQAAAPAAREQAPPAPKEQPAVAQPESPTPASGQAFLKENAKKPGVVVTASGLQYLVLTKGDGPKPAATDRVTVNYRGTLINGTEFDSSYKRGQPATFPLNRVIPGWTEGVQLMPVGSKYRFFIPPELAYGKRGAGGLIGPDATLVFEVELLGIEK